MREGKVERGGIGLRSLLLISFFVLILTFPSHDLVSNVSAQTALAYVPISLVNSQSLPTQAPFQESITINPSLYTEYENAQLGNIRFYSSFSGIYFTNAINAWMESFSGSPSANLATSASIWLDIPKGIGADSTITIYMVFETTITQFDGISWGEAPAISSTYAQYDNGGSVFDVYDNGNTLFPLSQTGTGGSTPSVTNTAPAPYARAISASVSGGGSGASTWSTNGENSTSILTSYIAQTLVYLSGSSPLTDLLTNVQSISSGEFYAFRLDARAGSFDLIGNYPTGSTSTNILAQSTTTSSAGTWYQMSAIDNGDTLSLYKSTSFGLASFGTMEAGPVAGKGYIGGGVALTTDGATSTEYWSMLVVRAYPPSGVMPSASEGSVMLVGPSSPYTLQYQQFTATTQSPSVIIGTTSTPSYVPIVITNKQSTATRSGLQVELNVDFSQYRSYLPSDAGNIRFFNSSTFSSSFELPAWLETYSGNTTDSASTATSSIVWVNLRGTVIGSSSSITVYMVFESAADFDGVNWGEAPELSSTVGAFDNGADVFTYYNVSPSGTLGWTVNGASGQTSSAPIGSYFHSTSAYYAKSANGNYLDSSIAGLGPNEVLTFWVYTTGLGNVFFLTNSAGNGQMARLDSRGGANWAGLAKTTSWTRWNAPSSGLDESPNKWSKFDVVINGSGAAAYIGSPLNNISTLGKFANSLAISNMGNYIGLVGDGLGNGFVTYWNGFIVRYYPPNDVPPTVSFGAIVVPGVSETVMPQLNEGSITLPSGMQFIENASAPTACASPSADTSLAIPAVSSYYTLLAGSSSCLWSTQFSNSTVISSGMWTLDLWASAVSAGLLQVSIYSTSSTGAVTGTILSGAPTAPISKTKSSVVTDLSGSGANIQSQGYLELVLKATSGGPSSFNLYWGSGQLASFESPELFSNVLIINNTSTSQFEIDLGVASISNIGRLTNMTAWFSSVNSPQIQLGSSISNPQLQGALVPAPARS
ncbi:MAG TPA: hypothetical protein VJN71_07115, partial [Nitrososphaerales archaeon]|nr:hypothetical protein [Nitrososphaerales archaeon]